jgi:hypothetical protein
MDNSSGMKVIRVLGCVLQKICDNNKDKPVDTACVTKFHALRPPSISVIDYLERIYKYAACSSECYVLSLIYIDRLIQRSNFVLTSLNVHRVIITSITLAAKFFDDQFFDNAYYARVGGVPKLEMNAMELDFLFLINFSLFVSPSVYTTYFAELMKHSMLSDRLNCGCAGIDLTVEYDEYEKSKQVTHKQKNINIPIPLSSNKAFV